MTDEKKIGSKFNSAEFSNVTKFTTCLLNLKKKQGDIKWDISFI